MAKWTPVACVRGPQRVSETYGKMRGWENGGYNQEKNLMGCVGSGERPGSDGARAAQSLIKIPGNRIIIHKNPQKLHKILKKMKKTGIFACFLYNYIVSSV